MTKWGRPEKFGERVAELRDDDVDPTASRPGDEEDVAAEGMFAGRHEAADIFRRLFAECLPAKGYATRMGAGRAWRAGYNRMVAIAYCTAPEMFNGMRPQEVAAALGMSWWAFRKQLRAVRDLLEARKGAAAKPRRGRDGNA